VKPSLSVREQKEMELQAMVEDDFSLTKIIGDSLKKSYHKAKSKIVNSDLYKGKFKKSD